MSVTDMNTKNKKKKQTKKDRPSIHIQSIGGTGKRSRPVMQWLKGHLNEAHPASRAKGIIMLWNVHIHENVLKIHK